MSSKVLFLRLIQSQYFGSKTKSGPNDETLQEKEKIIVNSIISFSHKVCYPITGLDLHVVSAGTEDVCQPFPKQQILDLSKLKEFADNNFSFVENGRKLLKQVENTAGKGEIARYEQFLLFPQCFRQTCTADIQKPELVWKGANFIHFALGSFRQTTM